MMQLTYKMMKLEGGRLMKKILLAILGAVVFGKLFPIILLALLMVGLAVIVKEAADHEN